MKVVAVRDAKASLSEYLNAAQHDRVLITRHGKPTALVIGVEGQELEDLLTMGNPRFWEMLESRRRSNRTLPLEEVLARFGLSTRRKASRPGKHRQSQGSKRRN